MTVFSDSKPSIALHRQFAPATRLLWSAGILGALDGIARAGFLAAEVWASHITDSGVPPFLVKKRADELGLKLSLHAPSYDLNPLSSNAEIRSLSRRLVLDSLEVAAQLEAKIAVVHPGALSSTTDDPENYWGKLEEFLVQLDSRAARLGLTVAVEAMEKKKLQFVTGIASLERLASLMVSVNARHLGICLDIAHAGTLGDPEEFLARVPRVVHVHLSDTSAEKTHALLGEGRLALPKIIPQLLDKMQDSTGFIVIEGRLASDEPRAIAVAAKYLAPFTS